jgi:hypothetical protein
VQECVGGMCKGLIMRPKSVCVLLFHCHTTTTVLYHIILLSKKVVNNSEGGRWVRDITAIVLRM